MIVKVHLDDSVLLEAGLTAASLAAEVRLELALALYRRNAISAGRAAELADVSRGEMERVLTERKMRHEYTAADLEMDLALASEDGVVF